MEYEVAVHDSRVFTDSGAVPDNVTTDRYAKLLKQANLWDSCVFFADAARGVKKDGNEYVSKLYDLKANADCAQTTGTRQPKYNTDGSLQYDGGDFIISNTLSVDNPIRNITTNMTVAISVSLDASSTTERIIMCRWGIGSNLSTCLWLLEVNTSKKIRVIISDGITSGFNKSFFCNNTITSGFHRIAFTYDGNAMDGSVHGVLKLYVDGVLQSVTKTKNINLSTLRSIDRSVQVSGMNNTTSSLLKNGEKTALPTIYNATLTDEQILWDYDNILVEA